MIALSSSEQDEDFAILSLLLLSHHGMIIGSALSQASLKHFLSLLEKQRRDHRIP
jgi:hypothetical protein